MEHRVKRLAQLALFAACAVLPLAGLGCEKSESAADRRVRDHLTSARLTRNEKGREAAHSELSKAAQETEASFGGKAIAKAAVGESEYAAALALMPQLDALEVGALQSLGNITRLSNQIGNEVLAIDSYKAEAAKGGAEAIKALTALAANTSAKAAEHTAQKKGLETKRQAKSTQIIETETQMKAASEQANTLMAKSEAVKGQESVDLFGQSVTQRKVAQDLSAKLELLKVELARIESHIVDADRNAQLAQESASVAQKQIASVNESSKQTLKAIADHTAAAKAIMDAGGLTALAKEFARLKTEAEALRKTIDAHLEAAETAYAAADVSAAHFTVELTPKVRENRDSPERVAWERSLKANDPMSYQLARAEVLKARGNLNFHLRNLLQAQETLVQTFKPIAEKATITLPPELEAADVQKQVATATATIKKQYADGSEELNKALEKDEVQNGRWSQHIEAKLLQLSLKYSQYSLGDAAALAAAKDQLKSLVAPDGPNVSFPDLPADLEAGLITRTVSLPTPTTRGTTPTTTTPVPTTGGTPGNTETPVTPTTPSGDATPPSAPEGGGVLFKALKRAGGAFGGKGGAAAPTPDK